MAETYLFLAPHPDDAALSCGGWIAQCAEAGITCVIYTLLAGDSPVPAPDTPLVRELHERWQAGVQPMLTRRDEDRRAAALLGAEIQFADLHDCIYRTASDGTPLYPEGNSLNWTVQAGDSIAAQLDALTLPHAADLTRIYAPLAVGHHVDHQAVRDWSLRLAADFATRQPEVEFWFYEDYPYAETSGATTAALARLEALSLRLDLEIAMLHENDIRVKLESLRQYGSQLGSFWGSPDEMDQHIRSFMRRAAADEDTYGERSWRYRHQAVRDRGGVA